MKVTEWTLNDDSRLSEVNLVIFIISICNGEILGRILLIVEINNKTKNWSFNVKILNGLFAYVSLADYQMLRVFKWYMLHVV